MNLRPYEVFNDLKTRYTAVKVEIVPTDVNFHANNFASPAKYVDFLFKKKGISINRFRHKYDSLEGPNPELGVVYLASDKSTDIQPIVEAWVLIGHNATYIERIQSEHGIK